MKFNVKICPVCGQVWEKGGHNNTQTVYHGTDWPMKSYLDKGVCFGCSTLPFADMLFMKGKLFNTIIYSGFIAVDITTIVAIVVLFC